MAKSKIDSRIEKLFPGWGARRAEARTQLDFLSKVGGYDSASSVNSSFQNFVTQLMDADGSVEYGDLEKLRNQSREFTRNIAIANGTIKRICDHAIGDKGLMLHPKIDSEFLGMSKEDARDWQRKTAKEWRNFSESKESDFNRTLTFSEQTYLTLQS